MARLIGINHVALEVGNLDEALAWYGRFFELELRGRAGDHMAFVDMGDQFIALARGRTQPPDDARHFGLVVDDKAAVRQALEEAGAELTGTRGATTSKSSTTARSSSRRPTTSPAGWPSTG